jgi:hypothetical protein
MTYTLTAAPLLPRLAQDATLSPDTRIWTYITNRPLTPDEAATVQAACDQFVAQWTAHNAALTARAEVFSNNFVLLAVDESRTDASGCSIDKSVHFLEALGQQIGVDFFERMRFGWVEAGQIRMAMRDEFAAQVRAGQITPEVLMVNTLAPTRREVAEKWLQPFRDSWHARLV